MQRSWLAAHRAQFVCFWRDSWRLKETTMPYYKQRKIEITSKRQADGTWQCSYRIIEFHSNCWRFHTGSPEGSFLSRGGAIATALTEAKRIVDAVDVPAQSGLYKAAPIGRLYRNSRRRLRCLFWRAGALVRTLTRVACSAVARRERKPT